MENCNICDGPMMLLGRMGNRVHFRCRNCGMDQSIVSFDGPLDDEPDDEEVEIPVSRRQRYSPFDDPPEYHESFA